MNEESPKLFGILPTYARQELLPRTLRSIMAQTRPPDALVIVDNEASPKTRELVEEFQAEFPELDVKLIEAPDNLGSAGGWALAFEDTISRTTDQDWFATFDDDDPPIFPDELERVFGLALESRESSPDTAAVGIVGARFDWTKGVLVRPEDSELSGPVEVDYVGSGHGAMYSAAVVRRYGGFRAELFFGFTEVEYCLRLRKAGFRIFAHGDLWRKHRERFKRTNLKSKPSRVCTDRWKKYYSIRNYIFMMMNFRRYDLVLRQALIQVVFKPLYTLPHDWRLAFRGFKMALQAVIDGVQRRMGRTFVPNDFSADS